MKLLLPIAAFALVGAACSGETTPATPTPAPVAEAPAPAPALGDTTIAGGSR